MAKTPIRKCQLHITLPVSSKMTFNEYIHSDNINETRWDNIPDIERVRAFFNEQYQQANNRDISCE